MDANEDETPKLKRSRTLPKAVYFSLAIGFLGGLGSWLSSSVLEMYKLHSLGLTPKTSKMIFHGLPIFTIIFVIMWGLLSDNTLGKIKVIVIASVCGCITYTVFTISSIDSLGFNKLTCFLAAVASGSILSSGKPAAFNTLMAQQFVLPDQVVALEFYYMLTYWIFNIVAMIGIIAGPIMRQTGCLGMQFCFILPFGINCIIVYINFGIFLCGLPFYKIRPIKKNIIVDVMKCIWASYLRFLYIHLLIYVHI